MKTLTLHGVMISYKHYMLFLLLRRLGVFKLKIYDCRVGGVNDE